MGGIIIKQGKDVDAQYQGHLLIGTTPLCAAPDNLSASASSGGHLTNGVTYYYKVASVSEDGESVLSKEGSATASTPNLTIALTWDAVDYCSKYKVYRGVASGVYTSIFYSSTNALTDDGTLTPDIYIPTGLAAAAYTGGTLADDTYYYIVSAVRGGVETLALTEVNATTSGANNSVKVTWSPVPYAEKYKVYKSTVSGSYGIYAETTDFHMIDNGSKYFRKGVYPSTNPYTVQNYDPIELSWITSISPVYIPESIVNEETIPATSQIVLHIGDNQEQLKIDLTKVLNQSTWNLGTQAATQKAVNDILQWKAAL